MPAGSTYLSPQSLTKIRELAQSGEISGDALIVPYGKGKFYLATRQSRVAAFLPTFLNRLLKLTVHDGHETAGRAFEIFKHSVGTGREDGGSSFFQTRSIQPKKIADEASEKFKLTLGYAAKIIESVNEYDSRKQLSVTDRYVPEMEKILENFLLKPMSKTIVAVVGQYLPDSQQQDTGSSYEKILGDISLPKDKVEKISENKRLLYQFRLLEMAIAAYKGGLLHTPEYAPLDRDGTTKVVEDIAKIAAYRTFNPDAAGGRGLEKSLTPTGYDVDRMAVITWKEIIRTGSEITKLPELDA